MDKELYHFMNAYIEKKSIEKKLSLKNSEYKIGKRL